MKKESSEKEDPIFKIQENDFETKIIIDHNIILNYKTSTNINPKIDVEAGTEYSVSYTSSNPSVARVDDNGNVYGAKRGSATITCTVTDSDGNEATNTCDVKVKYTFGQWLIKILLFGWIWY